MKKHVKIYMDYFGYTRADEGIMPCEMGCGVVADVHHINPRGMGGNPTKDVIENLIGLCRPKHELAESGDITKEELKAIVARRNR